MGCLLLPRILPAAESLELTPERASELARRNHPELKIARAFVVEAEARAETSGRLQNPSLETELAGGRDFEGRASVGIAQRFPLTARLAAEKNISSLDIQRARLEVLSREISITEAARTAFYEYAAAREAVALARHQTTTAEAWEQTLRKSASEGFDSPLDADRAALATGMMKVSVETLQAGEILAASRLADALGLPADSVFRTDRALRLPDIPPERTPGIRPDLLLAELAVETAEADIRLAKTARWEDVELGVFVESERFRDEPNGIEPETLVGARLQIPLPLWQNGSGRIGEKQAARTGAVARREALQKTARNQTLAARRILLSRHRAAKLIQTNLIPAATRQLADTEAAHARGEADAQSVFHAREKLAEAESAGLEARKAYFLSEAAWLATLGQTDLKP